MIATLQDDFKIEISIGNITPETEHHFKEVLTKISFSKKTMANYLSKLLEQCKTQMKEALKI